MQKFDNASLWETKVGADVHLGMGVAKWELHEDVIAGQSGQVDLMMSQAKKENGFKKITLKEHSYTVPALETTLHFLYVGDKVPFVKTDVLELLAIYDVSASLDIPTLGNMVASCVGNRMGTILATRMDLLDDVFTATEIIIREESESWKTINQELQKAFAPHLDMLLRQQQFSKLLKEHHPFCFQTLGAAVEEIKKLKVDFTKVQSEIDLLLPETPKTSMGVDKGCPRSNEPPFFSPLFKKADAQSTTFATSYFRQALDSKAFNFHFEEDSCASRKHSPNKQRIEASVNPSTEDGGLAFKKTDQTKCYQSGTLIDIECESEVSSAAFGREGCSPAYEFYGTRLEQPATVLVDTFEFQCSPPKKDDCVVTNTINELELGSKVDNALNHAQPRTMPDDQSQLEHDSSPRMDAVVVGSKTDSENAQKLPSADNSNALTIEWHMELDVLGLMLQGR
nr:uncharacterized protein CTRU02_06143 [Colletotrichum truncatum]KAF6793271.1 hypothetical protein CTRU02_06143 [Colletotrichum truncatum]